MRCRAVHTGRQQIVPVKPLLSEGREWKLDCQQLVWPEN